MKRLLYLFIITALFGTKSASAQFAMAHDTTTSAAYGYIDVYNNMTNHKNDTGRITWRIIYHNLPASWVNNASFGLCDNVTCYDNAILTGSTQVTDTIGAHKTSMFKLQLNVSAASVVPTPAGSPMYVTAELKDGVTTDTVTFAVYKWTTNVAKINVDKDEVSIYPNPAYGDLNITYSKDAGIKTIAIYNLVGKQISAYRPTSNTSAKLDIDKIPAGIYFVRLMDAQGKVVATRRFTHQ